MTWMTILGNALLTMFVVILLLLAIVACVFVFIVCVSKVIKTGCKPEGDKEEDDGIK